MARRKGAAGGMYCNALTNVKQALELGPLTIPELEKKAGYSDSTIEKALRTLMRRGVVAVVDHARQRTHGCHGRRRYGLASYSPVAEETLQVIQHEVGVTLEEVRAIPKGRPTQADAAKRRALVRRLLDQKTKQADIAELTGISLSRIRGMAGEYNKEIAQCSKQRA